MGDVSKDLLGILFQLAPGFVAAWVLYGLTSYQKPSQFERVIQALIFSFLINALLPFEKSIALYVGRFISLGYWNGKSEIAALALTGVAFGIVGSYFANNDGLYGIGRRLKLTRRTTYPSEWYGAFSDQIRYVVLHLSGSRRIIGWPRQWPSESQTGHFMLMDAAWLVEDGREIPLTRDESILIAAKDVEMVEFLRTDEEISHGTEAAEPTSAVIVAQSADA
jgi:hypothetical protein